MKTLNLIALFLVLSVTSLAQTKNFNRTMEFSAGGNLRIRTDIGSVRLTSWNNNQVEVIARIEGRDNNNVSADYMRRVVEATQIEMLGDARSLTIQANYDNIPYENIWGGKNRVLPRIDWEIRAPRQANIDLDVDRSEAEIRGFDGRHTLKSDRTTFRAEDLSGEIRLHIDRGNQSRLANLRGKLDIESDRTNLTFERLQLSGDSRVQIGRGELEMQMASSQGFTLMMDKERRSSFKSDFPITTSGIFNDRFEGAINGGGPRLAIQTDRAKVYLKNN